MANKSRHILPGFYPSLSFTLTYLGVLVVIPLAACVLKASSLTWSQFCAAVWTERARAAYAVTLGTSLAAAGASVVLGMIVAWVLVRYEFPGKRLIDALIDLPFALPTAVAGLVFAGLYAKNGWLGQFLVPMGIELAYTQLAIVLVLTFVGFPFVVRTVQPVLAAVEADVEEAAAILGANRWQVLRRVLLPTIGPALLTGFALALARGLGEYGSVIFVSGNMPYRTEIAPVLIVSRLEEFAYAEATAIAVVLLLLAFMLLVLVNFLERRMHRHAG